MSRYRTIKPDFWTSEQIVECSPIARLLFVGMWNFCDDAGVHPDSPKKLKMEIFPADDITVDEIKSMVDELVAANLLERFEAENKQYLCVTGWHHQKIDRPSYRFPSPPSRRTVDDGSTTARRTVDEPSALEGSREESNKSLDRSTKKPAAKSNRLPSDWQAQFDEFRSAYPSRGKATDPPKPAREKFAKLIRDGTDPAQIITGAKGYAAAMRDTGKAGSEYVMQMTRFLNQAVWEQYQLGDPGANGVDMGPVYQRALKEADYEAGFPDGEKHQAVADELRRLKRDGDVPGAQLAAQRYLDERGIGP